MNELLINQSGLVTIASQDAEHLSPVHSYLISLGSNKSRVTARSILDNVAAMFGAAGCLYFEWHLLRRDHFLAIIAELQRKELAPATINTYLTITKGVMKECWQKRMIDIDTLERIRSVKRVRGSRMSKGRAINADEISALLAACNDDSIAGIRDSAIIGMMAGCGLRRSEIVSIDVAHIDFDDRAVRVFGKGDKERIAFIPNGAWSKLISWLNDVRGFWDGPLFLRIRKSGDVTNDRLTDQAIYHILTNRKGMAGIDDLSPHDLRRTFATSLLNNGEDISTVKDAMGHANISTTQKYDMRGAERMRAARDRLDIG